MRSVNTRVFIGWVEMVEIHLESLLSFLLETVLVPHAVGV